MRGTKRDFHGQRFGKLVVVKVLNERKNGGLVWLCSCDCGQTTHVMSGSLGAGRSTSCGCNRVGKFTRLSHGYTRSPEHRAWEAMKQRCHNPNANGYKYYGGRGIEVCEEWRDNFEAFLEHIGLRPAPRLTVDRIDNDKGYEPGNVRWATKQQQADNRRCSVRYKFSTSSQFSSKVGWL